MTTDQKPEEGEPGVSRTGHGTPAQAVHEGEADVLQLPVSRGTETVVADDPDRVLQPSTRLTPFGADRVRAASKEN